MEWTRRRCFCSYLRVDGASTRNDAGDTLRCERDVPQQHACMDGEVVHALHKPFSGLRQT